jgi:hypothetical protein
LCTVYEHETEAEKNRAPSSTDSGQRSNLSQYSQIRLPGLIEAHVEQILQKELRPLEARIKSMVQDIARKCVSDLVKEWQTSESRTDPLTSSQHLGEAEELTHTYTEPGPPGAPGNSQEYLYSEEVPPFGTQNQAPSFAGPSYNGFLDHSAFMGTGFSSNVLTQTANWMSPMTTEPSMNAEYFSFQEEDMQVPDYFYLENPPHS